MVIMAIDYGKARTGLAICDKAEMLASPLCVIHERNTDLLTDKIAALALDKKCELVVVGLPKNMDGTEGESAENARIIASDISKKSGIPHTFRDERCTTITAYTYLNDGNVYGKKRKAVVDSVAATIILQDFLDYRRLNNPNKG